ncbi:GCN5-related N-acetyltransferase (GNAT) domain-containing protein [Pochonia chlamydosporia 170]|uniref:GCN5-related N-acetyltransferase (GNAT) domain-containing protein n=1 Tax=Pochonia chlamydosporia 170 TaxID=1380566 RepID=A0A179F4J8_METCM|nr:GCN5-related N-acetyltransferase (GNAT) domain-containing protein [Pochonia chlamydosporia 170]OAQ60332.1 GCN5-related N-acetyltransferase (GNAT) domain-containing protein [Pochonia chlamydosporia 170]
MGSAATILTYRKAVDRDARDVKVLVQSAYRGDSSRTGWTTEADLVEDERIDEAGVLQKINQKNGLVLVAHDETGALAGCCEIEGKEGGIGYFGLFAVDPTRQAGGLGKRILAEAETMARDELGVRLMEMLVIWTRKELIDWYVRRGYTLTDRTKPFPYAHLVNGKALREDLHFVVLEKQL